MFIKKYLYPKRKDSNLSINILLSFLSRAGGAAIGFLIIPSIIDVIDKDNYGTYLSIISFFVLTQILDFGVNNVIKNKVSGHLEEKRYLQASLYFTNSYIFVIFVGIMFIVLSTIFYFFFENIYVYIFNLKSENSDWIGIVFLVICLTLLNFLAQPGINLLYCQNKTYLAYFINFIGQLIGFSLFIILKETYIDKIYLTVFCIYGAPCILNIICVLYFQFSDKSLVKIKPMLFDFEIVREILMDSLRFFIIQIASVVQFQLSNYLVSIYFNPYKVAEFNVYNKYFSVVQILLSIISTPYWISFARFYSSQNYTKLNRELKNFQNSVYLISIFLVFQYLIGPMVFQFWLSDKVSYEYETSFYIMIYYLLYINGATYVIFMNSTSKLNVQVVTSIVSVFLFLFLLKYLSKLIGINSVSIALIVANFYGILIAPIQVMKFLKNKLKTVF
ncbi:hypothetical protein DR864_04400 [Runella rosea]|uniref:Polysaccharide biosynthesis protein n=1 Tax=Runella rosea TaxID=2259595 RepID=A0A344TEF6_9BACT|nr:oligosaccharide flippase family protein [Runella rosea]AXE17027.1 hypothetical protein DR864_04400 [Runella rosea]